MLAIASCATGATEDTLPGGPGTDDADLDTGLADGTSGDSSVGDGIVDSSPSTDAANDSTASGDGMVGDALPTEALELCILNDAGPTGMCSATKELAFGTVGAGATVMRMFRLDNKGTNPVKIDAVALVGTGATLATARYEVDPGGGPLLRVTQAVPYTILSGKSLYVEVTVIGDATEGPLKAESVKVTYAFGATPVDEIVPIAGKTSGCPTGKANCTGDPTQGCVTEIETSNDHCGGCNNPCAPTNGVGKCEAGKCTLVSCTAPWADCDGDPLNGCETNLLTEIVSCGSCGNSCGRTNTDSFCNGGNCNIIGCHPGYGDCNLLAGDGCETDLKTTKAHCGGCNLNCAPANATSSCEEGVCKLTMCTAPYEDCDKKIENGCEINTQTDVANCGTCGKVCFFAHAAASCSTGMCAIGACVDGWNNCNSLPEDGCEVDLKNDTYNCGACNNNCRNTFPGAEVACNNGTCSLSACSPGFYDIDNNPNNGCEYACTVTGAADAPDDGYVDADCDGIDGSVTGAIFVATGGSDTNAGTKAFPVKTIGVGVGKALAAGKDQVYVSEGTYNETVVLTNGISIYGGYSAANGWKRNASYVTQVLVTSDSSGRRIAVQGNSITAPTTLDRLTIKTTSTTASGVSNYAMYCNGCTGLILKNSVLEAGAGGPGIPGINGFTGSSGGPGGIGLNGSCDDNTNGGAGGAGGTSSCGRGGGAGGKGGNYGNNAGTGGDTSATGLAGGSGGSGGGGPSCGFLCAGNCATGGAGNNGTGAASAGAAGADGTAGNGGTTTTGYWTPRAGGSGGTGTGGHGGGGGGGGGGQGGTCNNDGPGNGGGGGGAGGCPGSGASGGTGGGGSFGLFLTSSDGAKLLGNTITAGNGGNGGTGGTAGGGGTGGGAGTGALVCTNEVGKGGNGGAGGDGGRGGHGGGGAGGASCAVYKVSTTVSVSGNTLVPGTAGNGGASPGNAGSNGQSGTECP